MRSEAARSLSESLLGADRGESLHTEEEFEADNCRPWKHPPVPPHDPNEASQAVVRLGIWVGAVSVIWAALRCFVAIGIPYDGHAGWGPLWNFQSLQDLCTWATVLGVFTHAHAPMRLRRLFGCTRRTVWFLGVSICSGVGFGSMSDLESMRTSISSQTAWGLKFVAAVAAFGATTLIALIWHVAHARQQNALLSYLAPRLGVVVFYLAIALILISDDDDFEFHHYWLAWLVATWFCFDHAFSVFCLAVATGIFAQGVAAYDVAVLFSKSTDSR